MDVLNGVNIWFPAYDCANQYFYVSIVNMIMQWIVLYNRGTHTKNRPLNPATLQAKTYKIFIHGNYFNWPNLK